MFDLSILVRRVTCGPLGLAVLSLVLAGCGQKGSLYLPTGPAAANRATLPQTLTPAPTNPTVAPAPAPAASTPTGNSPP
ncbi:LPS translocon maturation chaperone LptM [Ramlibacter tataouinensis]|uniref:LPS translocon maturation chaperone LptM n=1 Tax=Ramlibacter tataouinensis TaxID=94132 RepID=UPI00059FC1E8|nr:lipoprotein [Ramlibacter tataouinensis]